MEQKPPVGNLKEKLEELDKPDFSIFQNQDEVVENIKEAAETVGVTTEGIDKLKEGKPLEFLVAKKNCKQCWGKGTVDFVPNEKRVWQQTKPMNPINSGPQGEYVGGRNTSLPEDMGDKRSRMTKALCKCVRIQME